MAAEVAPLQGTQLRDAAHWIPRRSPSSQGLGHGHAYGGS